MTVTKLKGLWIYNGVATIAFIALAGAVGARTSDSAAPAEVSPPVTAAPPTAPTFGLTAAAFQIAFNASAARVENGQHNDGLGTCAPNGAALVTCTMKDDVFIKGAKQFSAAGTPFPDGDKAIDEQVVLRLSGDRIVQVKVSGHRTIGHALHLSATLADAANALGANLVEENAVVSFIKDTRLFLAAGERTNVHKAWADISCGPIENDSDGFGCRFSPPDKTPAAEATPHEAPATTAQAPTLSELGAGTGSLWAKASDENKTLFAQTGIALIDQQRNIGMDEGGQRAVATWLEVCLNREAPRHPNQNLISLMNDCMQSMTPQDAAAIAIAKSEMKAGR